MTAMFSAHDHDDLDRVLGATGGIPDPADLHALADDAVAQPALEHTGAGSLEYLRGLTQ